ncbi:S8 family peptidase [Kitasatospora purpeofusca]|uniref:S8 family peptidase n=1 Tax=Kitasatospora purpeofusca TaxID=67352 RepID=UPI002A5AAE78|nr:S8 family peptidase [Kitasatospora purpeofusca]MDY0811435.1 S8 family peptidase [Kitasatospora purpeofusca]
MRLSARCASAALLLLIPLATAQGAVAEGTAGRAAAAPLQRAVQAVPGQYIVTVRQGLDPAATAAKVKGVEPLHTYRTVLNGFSARLDAHQLRMVRALPGVEAVEEDGRASIPKAVPASATTKREAASSWGLDRIDQKKLPLDESFTVEGDGAGVTAYVIGTGIEYAHEEFEGRATSGTDVVGDGQDGVDCNGHGTHIAGTIGGKTYGIARKVNLGSVRVLGCDGTGSYERLIAGFEWLAANAKKPAVANISLGGDVSEALNKAADALTDAGVLPILAAGNSSKDACFVSPASASRVITVAASNKWDEETAFTNLGPCVDLYAPGEEIVSAKLGGGSKADSGTSMAAPHVVGVVALYLAAHPNATPEDIAEWLQDNATTDVLTNVSKGTPNLLLYTNGL